MTEPTVYALVDAMPQKIHHDDLARTWSDLAKSLGLDPARGMEMIVAVPRDLTLRQQGQLDGAAWGGAWEWNLSDGVTKAAVVSALVAAALVAVGAGTGLAPVLIPTVVPFLFDVKRIRMERTADNYLRILGARADGPARTGTVGALYDTLPDDAKAAISKKDFESFLNQAVDAGRAELDGSTFEVLPNGDSAFRISVR